MRIRLFFFSVFCTFFIASAAAASPQPVAVISIRNIFDFSQKTSLFLAQADPQAGSRAAVLLSAWMLSPQLSSMDLQKPLSGYIFFSETTVQPVLFGTLRKGINPINIPFLPGQILVPVIKPGRKVMYIDPKFKKQVISLKEDSISPLPNGAVSGIYFFRDNYFPVNKNDCHEIALLMSTEFKKIIFYQLFEEH